MAERRQFLTGFATASAIGLAGCTLLDEEGETLPPDSSELFKDGELQAHNFAESSFTAEDVGTAVSEFDLANADTNNVETMEEMFWRAESFNQDISGWDISNVEDMNSMFQYAESFDQDIGSWDTSNVENMSAMFWLAESFDQDIGEWDTSNVEDMSGMFHVASSFNQDLSGWCVEQISDKPYWFDPGAGFEGDDGKQPNWGAPC